MLDKIKKYYAYVKKWSVSSFALAKLDTRLAFKKIFYSNDGIKVAVILAIIICAILFYLEPNSTVAAFLRGIRLWIEANALLFVGALVLMLFIRRFWGTLRAITLYDGLWKVLRGSTWIYFLFIALALLSDNWLIPNHPYYFLYIALFAQLIISLSLLSIVSVKRLLPVYGSLAEDEPIDDRSNMGPYQTGALDNLIEILSGQQQINSVGLYGEWGTGKTSIYHAAKKELSSKSANFIWVEIEPWRYTSQEALVLGFYEQLGYALERSIPGIQNTASNLLSIAEPLVRKVEPTGILESIHRKLTGLSGRELSSPAKYISKVLEREGKYLVVAVDNVERTSDAGQVHRTLQLVHFLKDPRITYIFISEKEMLLELIKTIAPNNAPLYLEKFIEHEINIFNPSTDQLNKFFIEKLSEYNIPGTLEDTRSIAKNFETYRGVIKVLNLFVFELNKRFLRNGEYTIDLGDKLRLDYLRAKYPTVWSHIERKRDYYDEGLREYDTLKYFAQSDDERSGERNSAVSKVVSMNVPEEKRDDVLDILKDLFPTLKHVLDNSPQSYKDTENWLLERRVAASDVLDEYFARNESLADYDTLVSEANIVLDKCEHRGFNSTRTSRYLTDFLKKHRTAGDANKAIRLLIRELFRRKLKKQQRKQFMRALIRVYASNHKTKLLDTEKVLTGILAGINQLENGLHDKPDVVKTDLNYIFSGLWGFCKNPSFMLRVLLFISPGRNNDLYNIQQWGGPTTGYQRYKKETLRNIKEYYETEGDFSDLFKDVSSQEWSFVFYQWSNAIAPKPYHERAPEQQANFSYVNKRLLEYFDLHPDMAYECLKQDFYVRDPMGSGESRSWNVSNDATNKYDLEPLIETVKNLVQDNSLSPRKQANLSVLQKRLESAFSSQQAQKKERERVRAIQAKRAGQS